MRIDLNRLMALCGCVGSMACGTPGGEDSRLTRSSWDTNLRVTITENRMQAPVSCPSVGFTMHVEPEGPDTLEADDLTVTLGSAGQVVTGRLMRTARTYQLAAPLPLPITGCSANSLEITQLSFGALDADADQIADAISGTGAGTGTFRGGDIIHSFSFSFAMSGTPDVTRPRLTSVAGHHPLSYVLLQASEPIASTSHLKLDGTSFVSLAAGDPAASAVGVLSSDVILPFSGSWTVAGDAEDLIGLPMEAGATLTSLEDPGLFADGGFEGTTLRAATEGDVRIVSSIGTLPALSGSQSLFVGARSSATFHLRRAAGASSVRFTSRVLMKRDLTSVHGIGVGVVGGSERLVPAVNGVWGDSVATGDSTWIRASARTDVTVALTEEGDDIVLLISPRAAPGCQDADFGLCPPVPALLIDDLRVE